MKYADLHLHTIASDGTYTPEGVVDAAKEVGLEIISVTDHDTTGALAEAIRHGLQVGVEVIPGIELTVDFHGREIHLLGYFIGFEDVEFQERLARFRAVRDQRAETMVKRLVELGYEISLSDLRSAMPLRGGSQAVGRLHVANALVKAGYFCDVDEAFDALLAQGRPAYVPKARMSPKEGLELIRRVGGVSSIAHPVVSRVSEEDLSELVELGVQAIEVWYPKHSPEQVEVLRAFAQRHGLLVTGGSDCHGSAKSQIYLGTVAIEEKYVEALRLAARVSSGHAATGAPAEPGANAAPGLPQEHTK